MFVLRMLAANTYLLWRPASQPSLPDTFHEVASRTVSKSFPTRVI
jgi:hypothetical protein